VTLMPILVASSSWLIGSPAGSTPRAISWRM
jgi:hypothetical protein